MAMVTMKMMMMIIVMVMVMATMEKTSTTMITMIAMITMLMFARWLLHVGAASLIIATHCHLWTCHCCIRSTTHK